MQGGSDKRLRNFEEIRDGYSDLKLPKEMDFKFKWLKRENHSVLVQKFLYTRERYSSMKVTNEITFSTF